MPRKAKFGNGDFERVLEDQRRQLIAERDEFNEKIDLIEEMQQKMYDPNTGSRKKSWPSTPKASKKKAGKRRGRRSSDEIKKEAAQIVEFIGKSGSEGRTGGEIRAKFPDAIGAGTTIRQYIQDKTGMKLAVKGKRRDMKYFVPKG